MLELLDFLLDLGDQLLHFPAACFFLVADRYQLPGLVCSLFIIDAYLGEIPVLDEMARHILHGLSLHLHGNIVPGHSGLRVSVKVGCIVLFHVVEVFDADVGIVDPGEGKEDLPGLLIVVRLVIEQMPLVVHPPEADIKPTQEPDLLVDHDHFFMVAPEKWQHVLWVAN